MDELRIDERMKNWINEKEKWMNGCMEIVKY